MITLDGEGITDAPDTPQRYVLLVAYDSATDRETAIAADSLSTEQVCEFLLSLPPRTIKYGYGLNYDVNQWLRDLGRSQLEQLWEDGEVRWHGYRIGWAPGKTFRVSDGRRRCSAWDVFGYFQCSLVDALRAWKIEVPVEDIAWGKMLRGHFAENDAFLRRYCGLEVRALAALIARLLDATRDAGITLHRYDGAGSIASSLLRSHGTKEYGGTLPKDLRWPVLSAYYGGRIEAGRVGEIGDVHSYDIRSAYPAATAQLPCLAHGAWEYRGSRTRERLDDPDAIVLAYVGWESMSQWPPLPWRRPSGGILFPQNGWGWHWGSEVRAAIRAEGDGIDVQDGWEFVPRCQHRPFAFLDQLYALRRAYADRGHAAEHVLKVGMAAISGKLAQSETRTQRRPPPYQHFAWAGMLTAHTRAQMLDAILTNPDAVVSTATDGIASVEPLGVQLSDTMGGWKHGMMRDLFLVAPGIYAARLADGSAYTRTRGFQWRELDWPALRRHWHAHWPLPYRWTGVRFHGYGVARVQSFGTWRAWQHVKQELPLFPQARFPDLSAEDRTVLRCQPPRFGIAASSAPFEPFEATRWIRDGRNQTALELLSYADDGRL